MRLPRHPAPWYTVFAIWFATLWWLSSGVPDVPEGLKFQASDKVLHFGYFFGGGGLFSAALFLHKPDLHTSTRMLIVIILVTMVGVIDEIHQSYIPGRSGNDVGDLIADFIGAIVGALVFQRFRRFLA